MRDFGTLPRAKVGKHKSTAADAADDVKRRDAVYREGRHYGLALAGSIVHAAPSLKEALRRIEEAMK